MKRKEFGQRLLLGGGTIALLPSMFLVQGCTYEPKLRTTLDESDISFLDELAETILPESKDTPGAKAAGVGAYILLMYQDCMETESQVIFVKGINELDLRAFQLYEDAFEDLEPDKKLAFLESIQAEAIAYQEENEGVSDPDPHYFDLLKGLAISGYFSSEIGMTQARNYLPVPGEFKPCIPYQAGDKPWSL
ncbi:MAG: gluconate 2-dehydrogenase subunit 3 family protein [Bacteroidota bacterium]